MLQLLASWQAMPPTTILHALCSLQCWVTSTDFPKMNSITRWHFWLASQIYPLENVYVCWKALFWRQVWKTKLLSAGLSLADCEVLLLHAIKAPLQLHGNVTSRGNVAESFSKDALVRRQRRFCSPARGSCQPLEHHTLPTRRDVFCGCG